MAENKIDVVNYNYDPDTDEVSIKISIPNKLITEENEDKLKEMVRSACWKAHENAMAEINANFILELMKEK